MVGDGKWLSTGEAAAVLGLHADKVRALGDTGKIKTWRPPDTGPGVAHRRYLAEDVERLRQEMHGDAG